MKFNSKSNYLNQFNFSIIFTCCFFITLNLSAQNQPKQFSIDSLKLRIQTHTNEDSTRVDLLNALGYRFWIISPDSSIYYGEESLEIANQINYLQGIAFANRVVGVAHWDKGNYELALAYLISAMETYKQISDQLGTANTLTNIGLVYSEKLSYDKALEYYVQSLEIHETIPDNLRTVAGISTNIGDVYYKQGKYQEALDYLDKGLKLYQQLDYTYGIGEVYNLIGLIKRETGNLSEALEYCLRALPFREEVEDKSGYTRNLECIASIYIAQQKYDKAIPYLDEAFDLATSYGYKKWLRDIYFDYKTIAEARQNHKAALDYFEAYVAVKDSLFNEEKAMQIADLQTFLEVKDEQEQIKLKKQRIAYLEQQSKLERYFRYSLIGGIVLVIFIAYLIYGRQKLRMKKDAELHQREKVLADLELENSKLKEIELQKKIEFKNKELTSYTINFIQKNELMEELKDSINQLKKHPKNNISRELNSLNRMIDNKFNIDKDWEDFRLYFEQVHQNFLSTLKSEFPEITHGELKLCTLLKLNLNLKEAASILGISPESVKTARYRLRKKLNLSREENLVDFIMKIGEEELSEV
ncbi:tetratricopeptide repeat protein [Flexithrix dorotheae]|uniref:tetratricopeptide repeat protein n=1 Tax=Flexithrix dorotheae TaxID=70993 RepID=UPI00146DA577|nr:tetratricopeptide repeat protein [Flexithrix dorotheae]